jgi:hypothetical protein
MGRDETNEITSRTPARKRRGAGRGCASGRIGPLGGTGPFGGAGDPLEELDPLLQTRHVSMAYGD